MASKKVHPALECVVCHGAFAKPYYALAAGPGKVHRHGGVGNYGVCSATCVRQANLDGRLVECHNVSGRPICSLCEAAEHPLGFSLAAHRTAHETTCEYHRMAADVAAVGKANVDICASWEEVQKMSAYDAGYAALQPNSTLPGNGLHVLCFSKQVVGGSSLRVAAYSSQPLTSAAADAVVAFVQQEATAGGHHRASAYALDASSGTLMAACGATAHMQGALRVMQDCSLAVALHSPALVPQAPHIMRRKGSLAQTAAQLPAAAASSPGRRAVLGNLANLPPHDAFKPGKQAGTEAVLPLAPTAASPVAPGSTPSAPAKDAAAVAALPLPPTAPRLAAPGPAPAAPLEEAAAASPLHAAAAQPAGSTLQALLAAGEQPGQEWGTANPTELQEMAARCACGSSLTIQLNNDNFVRFNVNKSTSHWTPTLAGSVPLFTVAAPGAARLFSGMVSLKETTRERRLEGSGPALQAVGAKNGSTIVLTVLCDALDKSVHRALLLQQASNTMKGGGIASFLQPGGGGGGSGKGAKRPGDPGTAPAKANRAKTGK